jgi:VWFA-related protein
MFKRGFELGVVVLAAGAFLEMCVPVAWSQPSQQPGQPTFRVAIDLVTLDAIPRDDRGQFVNNLGKEDFEIFEDGVKQDLASLTLVHGGRVFNLQTAAPPAPRVQEGIILPSTRPAAAHAGRIFIIVVDDLHLNAHDTPYVRELMKKIAATLIHEGDMFAIISTGPSTVEEPLSYDRQRIPGAISRIKGSGLELQDMFATPEGTLGPPEVRRRAHVAFSTAYQLIQDLEKVKDRRKALVLISNGYDFDPFPLGRQGKDQVFGGRYGTPYDEGRGELLLARPLGQEAYKFGDADLALELRGLADAANRANVSVYSIDPRGLAPVVTAGAQVDQSEMKTHLQKTQSSLRTLAEATGGVAVVNDNDFTGALKQIDAVTSDYYVLGYYSSNTDVTKRSRQIEVKVRREGVKVWSRSSYTLKPQTATRSNPRP